MQADQLKNDEVNMGIGRTLLDRNRDQKCAWEAPAPWHLRFGFMGNRQPRWGLMQHWSKPLDFNNPKLLYLGYKEGRQQIFHESALLDEMQHASALLLYSWSHQEADAVLERVVEALAGSLTEPGDKALVQQILDAYNRIPKFYEEG